MRAMRLLAGVLLGVLVVAGGALAADPTWPKEVTFALLSTESAPEIVKRWRPILAQLERDLGLTVKHTVATDYRGTIEALRFRKADIGWLGPKAYVEATNNNYANVEAIAQVRNENGSLGYRACLIAHSDSDIFSPEDIAGKTFAFNDPNSTSGYLVPMTFFLNEMSVDPKKHFSKVTFSGSHEASIYAVAHKKVEVASTNVPDMQQITREGKVARGDLRVIWVSKLIPLDPVVVRKDLPASLRQAIAESLFSMKERAPEAFAHAGSYFKGGFVPATDARYEVIREMNEAAKRLAAQK